MNLKLKLKNLLLFLRNQDEPSHRNVATNISTVLLALFSILPLPLAIFGFWIWFGTPFGLFGLLGFIASVIVVEFYIVKYFSIRD